MSSPGNRHSRARARSEWLQGVRQFKTTCEPSGLVTSSKKTRTCAFSKRCHPFSLNSVTPESLEFTCSLRVRSLTGEAKEDAQDARSTRSPGDATGGGLGPRDREAVWSVGADGAAHWPRAAGHRWGGAGGAPGPGYRPAGRGGGGAGGGGGGGGR